MIPDKVIALSRIVKENGRGMFFQFGGELNYFRAKDIHPGDNLVVVPLCYYSDDHKEYMVSKDLRNWGIILPGKETFKLITSPYFFGPLL